MILQSGCALSASNSRPLAPSPDFGNNVLILDPSMPTAAIQSKLDSIFTQQESNQFGSERYAILFKPGIYKNTVRVGFYTQLLGLGETPEVTIDCVWCAVGCSMV